MTYKEAREKIEQESTMSPSKRSQPVPCAYCTRGGNGDRTCSCGWKYKKYSKFNGCFSGELLPSAPES